MSYEELARVGVTLRVIERRLTQREAARMLGLTSRQVRRLRRAYEQDGARALASKHRGRRSNRRLASELRREALATVRSQYEGFGPTLAHEKLTELHGVRLSVETLRHWMTEDGLWVPRARREPRIQQPRHRRPCRGELIQIDGWRPRVVRGTRGALHSAGVRGRCHQRVDGASILRVGVGVLLLRGDAHPPCELIGRPASA